MSVVSSTGPDRCFAGRGDPQESCEVNPSGMKSFAWMTEELLITVNLLHKKYLLDEDGPFNANVFMCIIIVF
jgi:hypothetical protein